MATLYLDGVEWKLVQAALRALPQDTKREFTREVSSITRPIVAAMRSSVLGSNGGSGGTGLRAAVAGSLKTSRTDGGIRIYASPSALGWRAPALMDRGHWRHPVYGGPGWASQSTTAKGWFTDTAKSSHPAARRGVQNAVNQAIGKAARKIDAAG